MSVQEKSSFHPESFCLSQLKEEWKFSCPFSGKKILINIHITQSTLLLVDLFIHSGADFYVTCTSKLVCHEQSKRWLSEKGYYVSETSLATFNKDEFDIVLDCGAYLLDHFSPSLGFIELTHVDEKRYLGKAASVINVDSSFVKQIETYYGTGDGFLRAIKQISEEMRLDFLAIGYLVIGYGKVGKGICSALRRAGVSPACISVAEVNASLLQEAKRNKLTSFHIKEDHGRILSLLKSKAIQCVVTATGVDGMMSDYFEQEDFSDISILCNMGTDDEWGGRFSLQEISFSKKPVNFMLSDPTRVKYLDPIFSLLALAAKELIDSADIKIEGITSPSPGIQKKVLSTWLMENDAYAEEIHAMWLETFSHPLSET